MPLCKTFVCTVFIAGASVVFAEPSSRQPYSKMAPEQAARGLLQRLLPKYVDRFEFQAIPREGGLDVFEIENGDGKIVLRGSSAGAMSSALNWYLEHYCRCHVSWLGNQLNMPEPLPKVEAKIRRVSPHQYRYWLNYCAFSYSTAFWDWPRWEKFIDWMALHGVNMPLAITGQEATWMAVGKRFGLTDKQMAEFLPGPAYLPFGWMGCLDGWGGPLPASWIDKHLELQQRILARERDLGMTPLMQGFTGHVPAGFREKYPNVKYHQVRWGKFAPTTFIDPTDSFFVEVGRVFHDEQTKQFGTDHYYASDTFVEMMPPTNDPAFLAEMGKAVFKAMTASDPQAHWVMMGWIFINNPKFWQPPQAKALFGAVPDDRLIILEMGFEKFLVTEAYYGKPWIWTTIRNYGDVVDFGDKIGHLLGKVKEVRTSSRKGKLCGSGAIMEGLGYDPVVFEMVADLNWRNQITDADAWFAEFIHHRYGRQSQRMSKAWEGLRDTVYQKGGGDTVIWMRPGLNPRKRGGGPVAYDNLKLAAVARLMLDCADEYGKADTYLYDLVNVTRQTLANAARPIYDRMIKAARNKDRVRLAAEAAKLDVLIMDLDRLLNTRREFLLGAWVGDAKKWATNPAEARLYEWNARNQITLWGPPDSRLNGYARKQWAGLLADYHAGRWRLFAKRLDEALAAGKDFDADAFDKELQSWEDRWTHGSETYSAEPTGDPIAIVNELLIKHADEFGNQPDTRPWSKEELGDDH